MNKNEIIELLNDISSNENYDFDTIMKKLEILKCIDVEKLLEIEELLENEEE